MKKISSLFAVLSLAAVGLFTTSCSDNDNPVPVPKVVDDVTVDQTFVLQASSNVSATFTFNGVSKTGKEVEFETNRTTGTLTIKANGYVDETHEVEFSTDNTLAKISTVMVKPASITVPQAQAKGSSVSNDAENTQATGVSGTVSVPSDVNISGNTTDPFSMVVYKPAADIVADVTVNQVIDNTVSGVLCEPDGAMFNKPVTVTVTIPDAEGCEFAGPEGAASVSGNKISVEVSHFSRVPINMVAKVLRIVSGSVKNSRTIRIVKGINRFNFTQRTGFVALDAIISGGAKANYLESNHGANGSVVRDAQFEVDADGSAVIEEVQEYEDITYQSGNQTFTARVYRNVDASVVSTSVDPSAVHSGGSN